MLARELTRNGIVDSSAGVPYGDCRAATGEGW